MRPSKKHWLPVGLLCLALSPAGCSNKETRWETLVADGETAFQAGRYAEAEKLCLAALKEAEDFGEQDPRLATSLNNLAVLYDAQGNYAQAEPFYQRAITIYEKALGPEHPDVAAAINNLAELYRARGQHAQAEPLYQRELAILEKALGPEHPDVAATLENYALMLRVLDRHDEAEKMEARAKGIRAKHAQENPPN